MVRTLVLAPTRELAAQIADSFRAYGRFMRPALQVGVVVGGVSARPQMDMLARGLEVLVATPGRLLDLLATRRDALSKTEVLVLDEADHMLDLGFIIPIRRIVAMLPKARQTLLFSATMPREIAGLAGDLLRDPAQVSVAPVATTVEKVDQRVIFVNAAAKRDVLTELMREVDRRARHRLHPHQARRRPRRPASGEGRRRRAGHPRQQEPEPARARARRLPPRG